MKRHTLTATYGTYHPDLMLAVSFLRDDNFGFISNAPNGAEPAIIDTDSTSYGDDLVFPNGNRVVYKTAGPIYFQVKCVDQENAAIIILPAPISCYVARF